MGELAAEPIQELPRILKNFLENSCQIHEPQANYGIQVPLLLDDEMPGYQVVFLPELASKLLRKRPTSSTVFWVPTPGQGSPYMFFFFQDPSPKVMLNLICPTKPNANGMDEEATKQTPVPLEQSDQTQSESIDGKDSMLSYASLLDSADSAIQV